MKLDTPATVQLLKLLKGLFVDIKTLLELVDLKILSEEAGARFNGSNSSRCPLHHGNNLSAFHIYRGQDGIMRYHCFTNCPAGANGGNAIAFYMRWRNVDFKTAISELSQRAGLVDSGPVAQRHVVPVSTPQMIDPPDEPPSDKWQERALAFVDYAQGELWKGTAQGAQDYLVFDRGLTEDTIKRFCLGYNPRDLYDDPARWGESAGKKLWCPRGIVIPHTRDVRVWFVNVRRPLHGDGLAQRIGAVKDLTQTKFAGLRGGKRGLWKCFPKGLPILLLAEGEFDAMLAWQSAGDLCDVATLGGARHRIDALDAADLARASVIVAVLDSDHAGQLGDKYLSSVSKRVIVFEPPDHDLTDFWKRGGNLRRWIAGIIAPKMERLLAALGEHEQPDLFIQWLESYQRALDAETG